MSSDSENFVNFEDLVENENNEAFNKTKNEHLKIKRKRQVLIEPVDVDFFENFMKNLNDKIAKIKKEKYIIEK